jgi:hypothetical protein
MRFKKISYILIILLTCCNTKKVQVSTNNSSPIVRAKFEPAHGECLLFVGQDLAATGGLDQYKDGYVDHFAVPAGVTIYTGFSPGSNSFGYYQQGNDGLKTKANWGAGDNCGQCYVNDTTYQHSMLAIGLSIVGNEKAIAAGRRNHLIQELAEWIKQTKRPVFLRIGYEFDGWDWNHYNRKQYIKAWKHIHQQFKALKVTNVALVWQSKGNGTGLAMLEKWYPGDDVVDWCGYSYFHNPDTAMLTFARKHHKPVFIAEATPVLPNGVTFSNTKLSDSATAAKVWEEWFVPFFRTLDENKDVIKAFSYINTNWSAQPMWATNPVFQQVDSRIQTSTFVAEKWKQTIANPRYLKPSAELWNRLGYTLGK